MHGVVGRHLRISRVEAAAPADPTGDPRQLERHDIVVRVHRDQQDIVVGRPAVGRAIVARFSVQHQAEALGKRIVPFLQRHLATSGGYPGDVLDAVARELPAVQEAAAAQDRMRLA